MKARIIALALIVLVLAFVLPVFINTGPTKSLRFTAVVETPDGVKAGSSVVSFTSSTAPWWFPVQSRGSVLTRGEAVVVDLGSGRYLFVLMAPIKGVRRIFDTSKAEFYFFRDRRLLDADGNIAGTWQPMLISFENINDPKTGFEVDPDNLPASFGSGYLLRHIHVQETNETPTFGAMDKFDKLWGGFDEISRLGFTQARPK